MKLKIYMKAGKVLAPPPIPSGYEIRLRALKALLAPPIPSWCESENTYGSSKDIGGTANTLQT